MGHEAWDVLDRLSPVVPCPPSPQMSNPDPALPLQPDPQTLLNAISTMDSFRNPVDNSGNRNGTPRESLEKYLAETEKHIALLLPHTQITPTFEK